MPKRGEGPPNPSDIQWKGARSPEEIANLNKTAADNLGLSGRGEANRNALLAGIDKGIIGITRTKAAAVVALASDVTLIHAHNMVDTIIKSMHPKDMISRLHAIEFRPETKITPRDAAIALAFNGLTAPEEY